MRRLLFVLALMAALSASAAMAQKVYIDHDPGYDRSRVKTFTWAKTSETSMAESNALMHSRIVNAIEHHLSQGGLQEVESDPDVYVTYHTNSEEELAVNTTSWDYGYPGAWSWDPYWPGHYGGGWGSTILLLLALLTAVPAAAQDKPNILVIWGDDIGQSNISAYTRGMMGYRTPNIDRIANEGILFTDYYGEQSCTAGRSSFMLGQSVFRSGLSKVGLPGAKEGINILDPTIPAMLKDQGYATGQFGKNHFGDRDEHLPSNHGFDEFLGNLYHLNAEEEPEDEDYPSSVVLADGRTFDEAFGPRGVIHSFADGRIEDTLLAGCSTETEAPTTAALEPAAKAPPAATLSTAEAQRAAQALWTATLDGSTDAVRRALDGGADVNASDPDERTALMLAAFNGRTEVVRLLLERGARLADRDFMGRTALMYSSTGAFADTVELLLQNGAEANAADASEVWTPLMFAAGEGQMEVVRVLLRHGADPGLVDGDGDTAADHALTNGHEEVARVLRQAADR